MKNELHLNITGNYMESREILSRLENIEKNVNEITTALLGNEFNKTGIIHTVAEHHQRLNALERVLQNTKWLIIGLSVSSGIGLVKVIEILVKIISG